MNFQSLIHGFKDALINIFVLTMDQMISVCELGDLLWQTNEELSFNSAVPLSSTERLSAYWFWFYSPQL